MWTERKKRRQRLSYGGEHHVGGDLERDAFAYLGVCCPPAFRLLGV
jgi:hypothetical protein